MSSLATDEDRVPPIWERLPQVFGYPFKSACLTALSLYAVLYAIGILIPVIGLLFGLAAWIGLYKFAYDVLDATARGWDSPPEIQRGTSSLVLFKTIGLFMVLIFGLVMIASVTGSMLLLIAGVVFIVLATPAAIITLAITGSLINALNPATWVDIMRTVGLPYFIASLLLFMLGISRGVAESLLTGAVGAGFIGHIGLFLVGGYFLIASFHLMGYLVFQHHDALGVQQEVDASTRAAANDSRSPTLQQAEALVRDGNVDEAIALLYRELRTGGQPEEHDRYRKLLELQGRNEDLLAHGREYIPVLLYGVEQPKKALGVAEHCLKIDPRFEPSDPRQVRDLARIADRYDWHELVMRLTNGFAKRHPSHPDVVENYYLGARALFYGRGDETKALGVLRQLQKRFPEHPLKDDIDQLAATAENVANSVVGNSSSA
ncbi:hypothetical protein DES49_2513 [Halospina denitrificans]|uniref:Tetratricopeptide repeat protein n=1 Tax=Halospina denitrificans TaxID=332522 RepID=A0A4R7JM04_9GAMM|nr:DUF4013 domain-containing protein [Halospina denitrificans]TDT38536.1 hypothetical protein DES49_2513 [Halospina denitrificans]